MKTVKKMDVDFKQVCKDTWTAIFRYKNDNIDFSQIMPMYAKAVKTGEHCVIKTWIDICKKKYFCDSQDIIFWNDEDIV